MEQHRKLVHRVLSTFNLPIAPQTTDYLLHTLAEHGLVAGRDIEEAVEGIMTSLFIEQENVAEISVASLRPIIEKLAKDAAVDQNNAYAMMSEHLYVTQAPRLDYNYGKRQFLQQGENDKQPAALMSTAMHKARMFRGRFDIVKQRMVRMQVLITPIKNLLGCEGSEFTLLGMLSCLKQGEVHLEDLDASVKLHIDDNGDAAAAARGNKNIDGLQLGVGLFTECCLVLVTGVYFGPSGFGVTALQHPPVESRYESLRDLKRLDMFGCSAPLTHPNTLRQLVDSQSPAGSLLAISDFWLDDVAVIDRFKVILDGVEASVQYALQYGRMGNDVQFSYDVPVAIVLMGDFMSEGNVGNVEYMTRFKAAWQELWKLIASYKQVAKYTHFVFIPGPNDPWCPGLLPQPPLPSTLVQCPYSDLPGRKSGTTALRRELIHFAGNPCRVRFGGPVSIGYDTLSVQEADNSSQNFDLSNDKNLNDTVHLISENCSLKSVIGREMIFYRANVTAKMSRNVLIRPNLQAESSMTAHMVMTLLSQNHCSPLTPTLTPTVWSCDYELRLFPLPDLLVIADNSEAFRYTTANCQVANPGSFALNGYGITQYRFNCSTVERVIATTGD